MLQSVSLLFIYFEKGRVKNFIFYIFHILFDVVVGLTPLHLNKKYRK